MAAGVPFTSGDAAGHGLLGGDVTATPSLLRVIMELLVNVIVTVTDPTPPTAAGSLVGVPPLLLLLPVCVSAGVSVGSASASVSVHVSVSVSDSVSIVGLSGGWVTPLLMLLVVLLQLLRLCGEHLIPP